MARAWAGFSEEELRKLRQHQDPPEPPDRQRHRPVHKSRQQLQREKALRQQQKFGLQDEPTAVPPEQLLSAPQQKPGPQQPPTSPPLPPDGEPGHRTGNHRRDPGLENSRDSHEKVEDVIPKPNCTLEKKKVELQEKSHWEVLQQEQRLMEEKNKRKKALLAKAIAERSRRTQAETVKLKRIQKELQALDDMVSADIGILRNRIDQASMDYSYAR
ncbi:RAB6-interacting golgin isoform X2 [Tachyglossus aculeatus]|nr:RAB6-interacting golgin isoform X2 [Tachyglossus aculeatus]